jgi:hypothetical protein
MSRRSNRGKRPPQPMPKTIAKTEMAWRGRDASA